MGLFARVLLLGVLLLPATAFAQRQITTDHFTVYFNPNTENTAKRIADVAEEVFEALASSFKFYDHFSRIHILVHDEEDFSNGFANYYENRVEIWASDLDFPYLRGTHEWIKLVVTHELAHIVSLRMASKGILNAALLTTGQSNHNPDFSLVLPWIHLVAPGWYVEGIAQFEDDQIGYDAWDSHRDMLLRMATMENRLLTYSEMGVFSHNGVNSEMVYNQGYGLLRYIRDRFGKGKAEAIALEVGYIRFDPAVKKVLGVSTGQLYQDWKQSLRREYGDRLYKIASSRLGDAAGPVWQSGETVSDEDLNRLMGVFDRRFEGDILVDEGSFDLHPAYSPDGTKLAYLSNHDSDYAITSIWVLDLATGKRKDTHQRATTSIGWTPDSNALIYGRRRGAFYEMYRYDLRTKEAQQISANLRVRDPQMSPDGKTIAFVRIDDGSANLGLMNYDGTGVRYLTNNNDGTIYYTPRWSPDGNKIAFSLFRGTDRDIGLIDMAGKSFSRNRSKKEAEYDSLAFTDSTRFTPLLHSSADERDPSWLPDGSGMVFSSDRDGIFNLYEMTMATGEVRRRTDVSGSAFMSSVTPDGNRIAYAGYHAGNYTIFSVDRTTALSEPVEVPAIIRDYISILRQPRASDAYAIGGAGNRWSVSSIIPIIGFSQSFIGSEFGLNALDIGAQMTLHDILDRDQLFLRGSVGINFRHKIDPNLDGTVFYERQLPSVLTKSKALAPSVYGVYDRSIINNLRDRVSTFRDTSQVPLVVQFANGSIDTVTGTRIQNEVYQARDRFKYDFSTYAVGLRVPLTARQSLLIEHARRTYRESFESSGPDHLQLRIFLNAQEIASLDTTTLLSGRLLDDTKFFTNKSTLFYWNYQKLRPAVDSAINPSGGRDITLWFRRIGSTVTDSLLQPTGQVVYGQTIPIANTPGQFSVLTPARQRLTINELGFSWSEFIRLPAPRQTLNLFAFARYQDKRLREADEGGGFYWPLRVYLGGLGSLSGYPYFTLSGSKALLWRVSYTVPVFPNLHRRILGLYLDRLYLNGFWEGGTTWNFDKLTVDGLKSSRMLHDLGVQLRLQVFTFYRIPMMAFAQVGFPLTQLTARSRDNVGLLPGQKLDKARFYFGLGF